LAAIGKFYAALLRKLSEQAVKKPFLLVLFVVPQAQAHAGCAAI